MYVVKNVCQASLPSFVLADNLLFRSMPNRNCHLSSESLSLVGDNSLVHEIRKMAAVELHLNARYAQNSALKSVYEKSQWVVSYFPIMQRCLN